MIFPLSLLSAYIQIKAKIEVNGSDTNRDAHNGNRRDISDTAATINAVTSVFKIKYAILSLHPVYLNLELFFLISMRMPILSCMSFIFSMSCMCG